MNTSQSESIETKPYEDFSKFSWWRKDKDGWPIELYKSKPFLNCIRIVCQNIRKITG